ncbi:MAG: competence/damage-inducible protein A, partial [Anaerolineales bacterium]
MPSAEIITIGTEILLGEIVDTNASHLARVLREQGVDLFRKTTVGDNEERIAEVIRQAMSRAQIIITSGGLGPTVDDPTREAIALAVGVELEYRPELWDQIQERFRRFGRKPTENNRRQAYIPHGAITVENPVGTAPAFIVETPANSIIAFPGVPREMEYLLEHAAIPYLQNKYDLQSVIKIRLLHTAGVGESQIDELISDLETLTNPTVGLAAYTGQVDVRITAKADSDQKADEMIAEVERQLRLRLEDWVYGVDEETLENSALSALKASGWNLVVVVSGGGSFLVNRLALTGDDTFLGGEVLTKPVSPADLLQRTNDYRQKRRASVGLGVTIQARENLQEVHLVLITPHHTHQEMRPYGGPFISSNRANNPPVRIPIPV